jgi:glucokinase
MGDQHTAVGFEDAVPRRIEKFDLPAMRRLNALRILDAVRHHGPISRARLARQSKLSPPAVSALVEDLIAKRHLLREVGQGVSTGGRRPTLLAFAADQGCVVGIDLGSTTIRYALADLDGRILHRESEPTGNPTPGPLVTRLVAGISRLMAQVRPCPPLYAIAVGAPGMTDVRRGVVIDAANLRGWRDVPLAALLSRPLGVPVTLDNDVNMAALGEHWKGCARGVSQFVFVALGRGVGAGIMIDGRVHRGSQWYAGEISHLLLQAGQWRHDYGAQGFLEHEIGAAAIARRWRRASGVRRGDSGEIESLFAAARDGHPAASLIVSRVASLLGVAIANVVTTLDPELVVFGGGIGQVGEQLLDPVRRVIGRIVPNQPTIRMTALGGDAQLFGSLVSALRAADCIVHDAILGDTRLPRAAHVASSRAPQGTAARVSTARHR